MMDARSVGYTNARQRLPLVFREIIANDKERERLTELSVVGLMSLEDWGKLKELVADRKNLRRAAQIAMRRVPSEAAVI